MPSRRLENARDAAYVAHRVSEEHEVHHGVGLVVLQQRALEQARELAEGPHLAVALGLGLGFGFGLGFGLGFGFGLG
eukprot:scaffold80370_cov18-Phaeocystis_antarctica.AAC.1